MWWILFIIAIIYYMRRESFVNKETRVQQIVNWFKSNGPAPYQQFKRDLNGTSNIVEYHEAKKLLPNLTYESLIAKI